MQASIESDGSKRGRFLAVHGWRGGPPPNTATEEEKSNWFKRRISRSRSPSTSRRPGTLTPSKRLPVVPDCSSVPVEWASTPPDTIEKPATILISVVDNPPPANHEVPDITFANPPSDILVTARPEEQSAHPTSPLFHPPTADPAPQAPENPPSASIEDSTAVVTYTVQPPKKTLWERAIQKLPKTDQILTDLTNPDRLDVLNAILKAAEEKREICRAKVWRFPWKGKVIVLQDVADKTITWVNKVKTLGNMVEEENLVHPWALIRSILEIVVEDSEKMGEMLVGIERITNLMGRCEIYEKLYLKPGSDTEATKNLEEQLVELYSKILIYLINAKDCFSESEAVRITWSVSDAESFFEDLEDIYKQEVEVRTDVQLSEAQNSSNGMAEIIEILRQFSLPFVRMEKDLAIISDELGKALQDKILNWLSKVPYTHYHIEAISRREDGTCKWLLQRPEFQDWQMSSASGFLWLRGNSGTGKTTLTSTVVERATSNLQIPGNGESLAYFYCKRGETGLSDPADILRSIARQLSLRTPGPGLQRPVLTAYEANMIGESFNHLLDTQQCIKLIVELINLKLHTTIVIDALDECDSTKRTELFLGLREIVKNSTSLVKIFVSARDEDDISQQLACEPTISIGEKDNSKDIEHYLRKELKRRIKQKLFLLGEIGEDLELLIVSSLLEKASGKFLWVILQLNVLCVLDFESDLQESLANIPSKLEETYEAICERIKSQDGNSPEIAKTALMWVMCACEPLSPKELSSMLSAQYSTDVKQEVWLNICHSLLTVDTQLDVVRFFHLSVREFLENETYFTILESNTMAAQYCLARLNQPRVDACRTTKRYAVLHWGTHTQRCWNLSQSLDHNICHELQIFFGSFQKPSSAYLSWVHDLDHLDDIEGQRETHYSILMDEPSDTFGSSPACITATLGLLEPLKGLWDQRILGCGHNNEGGANPWHLAASRGQVDVLQILLDNEVDINTMDEHYGTALQATALHNHERALRFLLDHGAEVNTQGGDYGTALQAAAYTGSERLVQLLLDHGADANAQGGNYGTALHAAAYVGHERVVQLLLDNGADVNCRDDNYGTPLIAAACRGLEPVVFVLLNNGADLNIQADFTGAMRLVDIFQAVTTLPRRLGDKSSFYGTGLHAAVAGGHIGVVQLLLGKGADINIPSGGNRSGTALNSAAENGFKEIVRMLLDNGAEVNPRPGHHGTALNSAAESGFEEIVRMLFDNGADINTEYGDSRTPLQLAAANGYEKVVQVLLDNGADVNAQSGPLGTPLLTASFHGHEGVVQLLLKNGADPNVLSANNGALTTALLAATFQGHEGVVKILLDNGADTNPPSSKATEVEAEVIQDDEEIMQTLSDNGVNTNPPSGNATEVEAAVIQDDETIGQTLSDNETNTNTPSSKTTEIEAAVIQDHEDIMQTLSDNGANTYPPGSEAAKVEAAVIQDDETIGQTLSDNEANTKPPGSEATEIEAAVIQVDEGIVQTLSDNETNTNPPGSEATEVEAAVIQDHEEIMQTLSDNGANTNPPSGNATEVEVAVIQDDEEIIQRLSNNGANTNPPSGNATEVEAAVIQDDETIGQTLSENEANTYPPGSEATEVVIEVIQVDETIGQTLSDNEADADTHNVRSDSQTTLDLAIPHGHDGVEQILVENEVIDRTAPRSLFASAVTLPLGLLLLPAFAFMIGFSPSHYFMNYVHFIVHGSLHAVKVVGGSIARTVWMSWAKQ